MVKNEIQFTVSGDPKPLKRHRSRAVKTKTGKFFIQNYNPSDKDQDNFVAKCLWFKPDKPIASPVILDIEFYLKRPKSHYRTGKYSEMLKDSAPKFHTKKPDLDNLIKFVKDSLNGIFWNDDSQVYCIIAYKNYADPESGPETIIKIKEIADDR